ncbi:MAG: DnaJ domain-containing protein [Polyangiaceae bacterium]
MSRIARQLPGCDIRALPLKPSEAYVLSRLDAAIDERELSLLTGLPPEEVASALDRLHSLGAIEFVGQQVSLRPGSHPVSSGPVTPGSQVQETRKVATPPGGTAVHPLGRSALDHASGSPPLYDPAELDEDVEIDAEKRRRILDLYYRLDAFTYYELLGITDQADKKQIKSAYYVIAPEVHPDRFFRKRLGSYKSKIEALFTRMTLAHDVLTNRERRAEYDEYLEQTHKNRTMVALLEQTSRDIAAVESAVDESAAAMASLDASTPGRYVDTRPAETMQSRRETLARKLGVRFGGPPPTTPEAHRPANAEGLRARYMAARNEAKRQQIARFVESGKTALDKKDFAAAANAYRIAASLAPEDAELARTTADVSQQAAVALAAGFVKQAEYESSYARWHEAAMSYAKAATGMPDNGRIHERVAFTTLKSSGNARRAIEFARRAVELAPKEAEFHVTLARSYFAAGLDKSAQGELDRAVELAPKDARIKELVRLAREEPQPNG